MLGETPVEQCILALEALIHVGRHARLRLSLGTQRNAMFRALRNACERDIAEGELQSETRKIMTLSIVRIKM